MPECVQTQADQPAFTETLLAGPIPLSAFIQLGDSTEVLAQRADLLVALLTQSYDSETDVISYPEGVTVGNTGTSGGAYCDGVSSIYQKGLIDGYLVARLGYVVGSTVACAPYNWALDMKALQQGGLVTFIEDQIKALYYSPANAPPARNMRRKKVVVLGHSMGTLVSSSSALWSPAIRALVDDVVLLSPPTAGASLVWQIGLYGGDLKGAITDPDLALTPLQEDAIRYIIWRFGQISATGGVLAPYALPPYTFRRPSLRPQWANGFPATMEVGYASPLVDASPTVAITVGTQTGVFAGPLFKQEDGSGLFDYLGSIWARAHSYDQVVAGWTRRGRPSGVRLHCAYGTGLKTIQKSVAKVPFPWVGNPTDFVADFVEFLAISRVGDEEVSPDTGDSIVPIQGSQGCHRLADATGGSVSFRAGEDTGHIQVVSKVTPGSIDLLNRALRHAGVRIPTSP